MSIEESKLGFPKTDSNKMGKLCKALLNKYGYAASIPEEKIEQALKTLFPHYSEEQVADAIEYVKDTCIKSEADGLSEEDEGLKLWKPNPDVATRLKAWNTARTALMKINDTYEIDSAPFRRAPDAEPMSAGNMKRLKYLQTRNALESEKATEDYLKAASALLEALKEERRAANAIFPQANTTL
jgi:hypothetical protein